MDSLFLFFAVLIFRSLVVDSQTPSFRIRLFSDLRYVVATLHLLGCVFDASLLPILCSGSPPSILDIQTILGLRQPDKSWRDKWGVYIVVLEKPGCRPILYVGSSVNSQDGLHGRFADYFSATFRNVPRYVRRAIQNGYKVTYLAVPFYFVRPSNPVLLGFAQTLTLCVEHALTFRLWTMVGSWNNCQSLALWKKDAQEYDGANSHSCTFERRSLEDIKPEDIAQLLQERAERNKKKHDIWKATHQEEIRASKKAYQEEHKEERKTQKRDWNEANRDHVNEYNREVAKKNKESGKFICSGCQKPFGKQRELERHQDSEVACKPKRDAARTARLTCGGCNKEFSQMANLERHLADGSCRTDEENSCPTCGRVIKSKGNMRRHRATHGDVEAE
ncbi:hypothetical protein BKA63DRAFT_40801 [Paraphoma chrysanthemicola]|nr:hypothetical protein BKA63DRAFT_40801 [Paraphoma chrysanthemicola]